MSFGDFGNTIAPHGGFRSQAHPKIEHDFPETRFLKGNRSPFFCPTGAAE
jgi:hypothetical protein